MWYSTDQLNTPLLPVCVHTLLVCSPVNLLSFQHPTVNSPVHLNTEQDFFLLFSPDSYSNMLSSTSCTLSPISGFQLFVQFVILFFNETCDHSITNQQSSYYLITLTVTLSISVLWLLISPFVFVDVVWFKAQFVILKTFLHLK